MVHVLGDSPTQDPSQPQAARVSEDIGRNAYCYDPNVDVPILPWTLNWSLNL